MNHKSKKNESDPYLYMLFVLAFLVTLPGLYCGIVDKHLLPQFGAVMFGIAIFGAAFILSWAAEAAQIDISESLAVAILALIAVLPEYAVDFVFTWKAAHDPTQAHYAIANMTGANRLLVGLGWPLVLLIFILAKKKKAIILEKNHRVEIFYLGLATLLDQEWARYFIMFYTPLVIIMRLIALQSRLLQRKVEQADQVPVLVYHVIYALSFGLCVWDQWWLLAAGWAVIWILSAIYQARLGRKGNVSA